MRFTAPGMDALLDDVARRFRAARWPEPPAGYRRLGPLRPMRQVVGGRPNVGDRTIPVVVKWMRPVTLADRLARRARGGKGAREGRVLRVLAERGVTVPKVLAFTDDGVDLLVTEAIEDLTPLPEPQHAPRALVEAVARLLAHAWQAGLRHHDPHRGNVGLAGDRPVLVDVGGARLRRVSLEAALARAASAMAGDLSASQALRALRAWLRETGREPGRVALRDLARRVTARARALTRAYRRGRDRRARRSGRHFETFAMAGGGRGVRRRTSPEIWKESAAAWRTADPPGAVDLKGDGQVLRVRLPGRASEVVLKRYARVAPGRLPRPLRAFRTAVALEHRGIPVPEPLLALAGPGGAGFLVSDHVAGVDLHRFADGGRGGDLARLPPRARRALLEGLGRLLRRVHDAELSHRDLKAPNLLVREIGGRHEVLVSDLEGVRRRRGPVSWRRRARDLARLDASLDARPADRARVLAAYWRVRPRPPVDRTTFARWIAAAVARKRGPSGRPR